MVEKTRKLKEQLATAAASSGASSVAGTSREGEETCNPAPVKLPIFKGLTFWMTGRTCVPDQELKRLIVEHGGVYEQYVLHASPTSLLTIWQLEIKLGAN
jgi:hypothetical protein